MQRISLGGSVYGRSRLCGTSELDESEDVRRSEVGAEHDLED